MAKVSAHGAIVGTVEYLTKAKRFMADGVVLKDDGFGWKLAGKLKPGVAPSDAFAAAHARLEERLADRPAAREYRRLLHEMAGRSKRWKLHAAVRLLPDDSDGVWSEVCDGYGDNVSASVDEVSELCRAYLAFRRELGAATVEMVA